MLPDTGEQETGTPPSTASEAVGTVYEARAPLGPSASTTWAEGTPLNVGAVVSCTVTPKLALPVLPCESVAVHVTVVVPLAKVLPEGGEQLAEMLPSTASLADAENVTAAPEGTVAGTVMSEGTETSGGVVSTTVTLNDFDA